MAQKRSNHRRRQRSPRALVKRILVVTEGTLTEPQYVERLNGYLRSSGATAIVKPVGVGADPLKVVRTCLLERDRATQKSKPYDTCVCLVDVDQHAKLDDARSLARRESIALLVSNVKFEVWLRWHVEDKLSALTSAQLDRLVEGLGLVSGKALTPGFPIHGVRAACETARRADPAMAAGRTGPDPSSAMPILVELLLSP